MNNQPIINLNNSKKYCNSDVIFCYVKQSITSFRPFISWYCSLQADVPIIILCKLKIKPDCENHILLYLVTCTGVSSSFHVTFKYAWRVNQPFNRVADLTICPQQWYAISLAHYKYTAGDRGDDPRKFVKGSTNDRGEVECTLVTSVFAILRLFYLPSLWWIDFIDF